MSKKIIKVENKNQAEISNENIYVAFQLERLTQNFEKVLLYYNSAIDIQNESQSTVDELLNIYQKLIETNKKKDKLFCLDSFYFQYKIFKNELENLNNFRLLFSNRLYCEYYKLYMLMLTDLKDIDLLSADEYKTNKYDNYKDLEPYKQYSIEDIKSMNTEISHILNKLCIKYTKTNEYINNYNTNNQVGYSISNFLNSINYENNTLLEKITLYKNFIVFFDISHIRNFNKLIGDYTRFKNNMIDNISSSDYLSVNKLDDDKGVLNFDDINNDDINNDDINNDDINNDEYDVTNLNDQESKPESKLELEPEPEPEPVPESHELQNNDISFKNILDQSNEESPIEQNIP